MLLTMFAGYCLFGFFVGLIAGNCFVKTESNASNYEPKDLPMWVFVLMAITLLPFIAGMTISLEDQT